MPDRRLMIVTGAHLRAEEEDRPLAYALQRTLRTWMEGRDGFDGARAVVCSDLWYLNQDALRALPTISIGGPEVNALAACLADRLPSVFAIEGSLLVQADMEGEPPLASCWGSDAEGTRRAVGVMVERYLRAFVECAAGGW